MFVGMFFCLAAISKVLTTGWALIFEFGVFCVMLRDRSAGSPSFTVLTSCDPKQMKTLMSAELATAA